MVVKGILFDMDGVLIDTERLSTIAWQKTAKKWQIDLPVSFINSYKGKNLVESKKLYLERFGSDFPYDEFRAEKTESMQEHIRENGLPVKKGVYDLLNYAKEHQIRLAVATSTSRSTAEAYLRQVGIYDDFQAIVYGDSLAASKPKPDIYLEAAKRLGIRAEECLVIEDSTAGVLAGYNAGARVIHIPDQIAVPKEVLQKAYRIIEDMTKVIELIGEENHMSTKEKMHSTELYLPGDEELMKEQLGYLDRLYEFNQTRPSELDKREAMLKEMFAEIGEACYIEPPLHTNFGGHHIHFGHHIYANFNLTMVDDTHIYVGSHTMFGPNVTVATAGHPILPELRREEYQYNAPVHIGENCWLGAGVIVLPGITIGDNVVVGAGSIVTKDLPSNVVAVGNPCKVLREVNEHDKEFYFKDKRIDMK